MDYSGYDGEDDSAGETVGEEEIMGAVRRALATTRARPGGSMTRAQPPALGAASGRIQKLRGYLGLGRITFNSSTPTSQQLIVEPQRAFRPERLVIARRDGSSATAGNSCVVNNIFIGDQPQSPSQEQPAPTEMFSPDATYSGIDFDVCNGGIKIQVNLSISAAPTTTEFVILAMGFYGDMLRGTSAPTGGR